MEQIDSLLDSFRAANSGMKMQSLRLRTATENLSNIDTPGYHRKLITFREAKDGVSLDRLSLDPSKGETIYDPSHPLADKNGVVTLSNVNMMIEVADAREAGRSYEANLQVFGQARRLYESLWGILKR
ncbi:MAG: flagellar basal body rod C-terminal domain-containing protein [Parvularcula sp.]